jgi:ABC-type nickel/cobalt efflux system permease component RcnA
MPSGLDGTILWLAEQQRLLNRELAEHLRLLKTDGGATAAWGLAVAGFIYGVIHAAGPGHGKAILTTYLLTQRARMARGVVLAIVAAYCQGVVAVVLIYGLTRLAGWLPRETSAAVAWSERTSFALIVAVGGWLAIQATRRLLAGAGHAARQDHRHAADDRQAHASAQAAKDAGHCGHDHGPSSAQIERAHDLRAGLGVIASIGFRPCSGAILVLAFANALRMPWAGVAAVVAMSTGTGAATTTLAMLALTARSWAARLAEGRLSDAAAAVALNAAGLVGGTLLLLFGALMFAASWGPAHPLGL